MKNIIRSNKQIINEDQITVIGDECVINGDRCIIEGDKSIINGNHCSVYGQEAIINGDHCIVHGSASVINGNHCIADGNVGILRGKYCEITSSSSPSTKSTIRSKFGPPLSGNKRSAQYNNYGVIDTMGSGSIDLITEGPSDWYFSPFFDRENNHISGFHNVGTNRGNVVIRFGDNIQHHGRDELPPSKIAKKTTTTKKEPQKIHGTDEPMSEKDTDGCVICYLNKKKCVILPCMHHCLCINCANLLIEKKEKSCILCRSAISDIKLLF